MAACAASLLHSGHVFGLQAVKNLEVECAEIVRRRRCQMSRETGVFGRETGQRRGVGETRATIERIKQENGCEHIVEKHECNCGTVEACPSPRWTGPVLRGSGWFGAALIGTSLALSSPALAGAELVDASALQIRLQKQVELEMQEAILEPCASAGREKNASRDGEEQGLLNSQLSSTIRITSSLTAPSITSFSAPPQALACVAAAQPVVAVMTSLSATRPAMESVAAAQPAIGSATGWLATAARHFSGGGIAGAVGAAMVYPLDTVKTRMQAQTTKRGEEPQFKDGLDCFRQLVTKEGPASLYEGLLPQLIGIAPEKAVKLTVNELLLATLESSMPGARTWALEFIAGGGGGFSQVVFTNPMEIVKVRLQTQSKGGKAKNAWDVVKDLGMLGLYDGAAITMARDIPSTAIFFSGYSLLTQLYPGHNFEAGCIAAIPATVLVTPLDVIKTRLQKAPVHGEEAPTDAWDCLGRLWVEEGPKALFKGSLVRVLRTSPQFGITLVIYDLLCK